MEKPSLLVLVTSLVVAFVTWDMARAESFPIPKHGEVQLAVPEGWIGRISQPPGEYPPTINIKPKTGEPFEILITAIWRLGTDNTIYESALREQTEAAASKAQSQATEKKLVLKEISGTNGRGYYFVATDQAPKPGEYKYLTQGMLKIGNVALAFTILTNDGQADVVSSALEVLSTAQRR
jgi:hypothetical protein